MTLSDFTNYILSNMSRATLANALTLQSKFVVDKLAGDGQYVFNEFLSEILLSINNKTTAQNVNMYQVYKIIILVTECQKKLNSNVAYNSSILIDDFIINLWEILNGD